MQAIVNVSKHSAYARYNGLTFPVKEILSSIISLEIAGLTVDFSHAEAMIVNFAEEYQHAYDSSNWNSNKLATYNNLLRYRVRNGIDDIKLIYNCPA